MAARKSKDVVRYIGASDTRTIRTSDWAHLGIEQDDVTWDAANDFTVAVAGLHADALAFLKANEGEWLVLTEAQADEADAEHEQLEFGDES